MTSDHSSRIYSQINLFFIIGLNFMCCITPQKFFKWVGSNDAVKYSPWHVLLQAFGNLMRPVGCRRENLATFPGLFIFQLVMLQAILTFKMVSGIAHFPPFPHILNRRNFLKSCKSLYMLENTKLYFEPQLMLCCYGDISCL